eukprot:TRINITY_DN268_c8_g1_i1.p1 TRINITY_DN268_c8_g1~~TRINITY_DN268_c8_g1_i1.p1  ORF type:complete len:443 (+),score=90.26 TRINITY_DN268_c8_g1_i1:81-1331(+)
MHQQQEHSDPACAAPAPPEDAPPPAEPAVPAAAEGGPAPCSTPPPPPAAPPHDPAASGEHAGNCSRASTPPPPPPAPAQTAAADRGGDSAYATIAAAAARLRRLVLPRHPPSGGRGRGARRDAKPTDEDPPGAPLCTEAELQGRWRSTRKKGRAFMVIGHEALYERTGRRYPVTVRGPKGHLLLDGCVPTHTKRDPAGRVMELRWSDGDVWTRDDGSSAVRTPRGSASLPLFDGMSLRTGSAAEGDGTVRSPSALSFRSQSSTPSFCASTISASTPSTIRRGSAVPISRLHIPASRPCGDCDPSQRLRSPSRMDRIRCKALLQGRWRSSRKHGGRVEVLGLEAVYERSGKRYPVTELPGGGVSLDGCLISMTSRDGCEIHWTDGDVWTRDDPVDSYTPVDIPAPDEPHPPTSTPAG